MNVSISKESLKAFCLQSGFDAVGISNPKPNTWHLYNEWIAEGYHGEMGYLEKRLHERRNPDSVLGSPPSSIIVLAKNYLTVTQRTDENAPIVSRYAWGTDYHEWMGERASVICEWIKEQSGGEHHARWCVDTAPVLERDFAAQAGIGWVGKHTNVLSRTLGNWLFLSVILTTLPLPPDRPVNPYCGSCSRCLTACPTNAFVSPYTLDARRCISYLTIELRGSIPRELRPLIGARIFGCDDCLDACPWNRFALPTQDDTFYPRTIIQTADLITLMKFSTDDFRVQFKNNPIKRAKYYGFKRNVAVALGNTGDESVLHTLQNALLEEHPLIREHVVWAVGNIGGKMAADILKKQLETENHETVLTEIAFWLK